MSWYSDLRQKVVNIELRLLTLPHLINYIFDGTNRPIPLIPPRLIAFMYGKYAVEYFAERLRNKEYLYSSELPVEYLCDVCSYVGKSSVPVLVKLLKHQNDNARALAAYALQNISTRFEIPEAVGPLIESLNYNPSYKTVANGTIEEAVLKLCDKMTLEEAGALISTYVKSIETTRNPGEIERIKKTAIGCYTILVKERNENTPKLSMPGELLPPKIRPPKGNPSVYRVQLKQAVAR